MKKINYLVMMLAVAGTLFTSCKKKKDDVVTDPGTSSEPGILMTSFETGETNSTWPSAFYYTFDTDVITDTVKSGGSNPTAQKGNAMMHMKTTGASNVYYAGGFGWQPGTGVLFDTLDDNDQIQFYVNYNGNTTTSMIVQIKNNNGTPGTSTDDVTFVYNVPAVTANPGWNLITVDMGDLKWDQYNNASTASKDLNFGTQVDTFGFVYSANGVAGTAAQEVYIDNVRFVDVAGGNKIHTYPSN